MYFFDENKKKYSTDIFYRQLYGLLLSFTSSFVLLRIGKKVRFLANVQCVAVSLGVMFFLFPLCAAVTEADRLSGKRELFYGKF